jgi:hypothetical protein
MRLWQWWIKRIRTLYRAKRPTTSDACREYSPSSLYKLRYLGESGLCRRQCSLVLKRGAAHVLGEGLGTRGLRLWQMMDKPSQLQFVC